MPNFGIGKDFETAITKLENDLKSIADGEVIIAGTKDKPIVNESCISIYQETINALKYFTIYDEIQYVEFYEIIKRIEIALTDWVEITPRNNADNLSIITSEVIHNITEFFNVLLPEDVLEEFYGNPADDFIGDLD